MKEWGVQLTIDATAYVQDEHNHTPDEIREIACDAVTLYLSSDRGVVIELENVAADFPFDSLWPCDE